MHGISEYYMVFLHTTAFLVIGMYILCPVFVETPEIGDPPTTAWRKVALRLTVHADYLANVPGAGDGRLNGKIYILFGLPGLCPEPIVP